MKSQRTQSFIVTSSPKGHLIEDHAIEQQQLFNGIGDLEESFGEHNHQSETIADRCHGGTHDFRIKEKMKSYEKAKFSHPKVEAKIEDIKDKRKRKTKEG